MATFDISWNLTRRLSTPNPDGTPVEIRLYSAISNYGFTPGDPVSEEAFYNQMIVEYPEKLMEIFEVASGTGSVQYAPGEATVTLISDP